MQPPLLVLGAPAGFGVTRRGPLPPAARAETPHTGPPGETAPADSEPSTQPGGTDDTSDLHTITSLDRKRLDIMHIYLSTAVSNGGEEEEEMQRGTVGQIEVEPQEDFALHSQQLMLRVGVVHQVAESRHLGEEAQKRKNVSFVREGTRCLVVTDCYTHSRLKKFDSYPNYEFLWALKLQTCQSQVLVL